MHGPRSFAARWRQRRLDRRSDAGSMPLAMLVTLVGVSLSAGLGGVVMDQFKQSQRLADRVAAVDAAQAGLDAGLKAIRDTYAVTGALLDKLPCGVLTPPTDPTKNPFAALGKSTSATPGYTTTVGYFLTNPSNLVGQLQALGPLTNINKLASGRALTDVVTGVTDTVGLAKALTSAVGCVGSDVNGNGGTLQQVPLYGLLRSEGKVGGTKRVLYATYTFHTSEDNIPGGRIVVNATNVATKLCLGDLNGTPKPGDAVSAVPCTSPDEQAAFIYPNNLSLVLANTRAPTVTNKLTGLPVTSTGGTTYTYGLCITATTYATDAPVKFQECVSPKLATQQWNYDVNPQTYYANDGLNGAARYCLNAKDATVGSPIVLRKGGSNCGSANSNQRSFQPEASVGPGGAGPKSKQLVSTQEVGRCLDLTNENVNNNVKALITYPCKQSFVSDVYWNHKWIAPSVVAPAYKAIGQISTQPPNLVPYCMKSPGVANAFVWVAKCSDGGVNLQWTVYEDAPTYKESYQIVDQFGLCLMPAGSLGAAYRYNGLWSEVIVSTCTGKEIQKWNMPSSVDPSPLKSMKEK
ncbi:hypothetical protein [Actinoplanes sp. NPDC049599]|uniref:hypothetical protein n=1 Tax=Actinoplanes sp. NPDC049599 TaxID=3363903 RepID=UPI00379C3B95